MKAHPTARSFLAATRSMLEEREAENNLILGLATTLAGDRTYYGEAPPLLVSVHAGEACIGAALRTPPRNIILYARPGAATTFVRQLCTYLVAEGIRIPGVIGPKETVARFSEAWARQAGAQPIVEVREMVYRLDTVTAVPVAPGRFRRAEDSDRELLREWMLQFHAEAVEPISAVEAAQLTDRKLLEGALYVWEREAPVSLAGWVRPTRNGITIGPVYTPEAHRGKGYATSCVARLSDLLLEEYSFCSLFTDLSNPVSNSIYQKIGFRPINPVLQTRFEYR